MDLKGESLKRITSEGLKFIAISTDSEFDALLSSESISGKKGKTDFLKGQREKALSKISNGDGLDDYGHNNTRKLDDYLSEAKLEDDFEDKYESFRERLRELETVSKVIDTTNAALTGEGSATFTLPLGGEDVVFEVKEFQPEQIDIETEVLEFDNSRDQVSLESEPETKELISLISTFGQFMPAIAHQKAGNKKLSILDGSRRRFACIKAKKPFRVIISSREITVEEITVLKKIFKSQKELTYHEQCVEFCLEAEFYKENWKNSDSSYGKFSYENFGSQRNISKSKVYRIKEAGEINRCIVAAFHNPKILGESFFSRHLAPLIKDLRKEGIPEFEVSLIGFINREYEKLEEALELEKEKNPELDGVSFDDSAPKDIVEKAYAFFFSDKVKAVRPQADDAKKYLIGKKGDKDFLYIEDKGKFKKVTAKFSDPEKFERFSEMLESMT